MLAVYAMFEDVKELFDSGRRPFDAVEPAIPPAPTEGQARSGTLLDTSRGLPDSGLQMILLDRWMRFWTAANAKGDPAAPWEFLASRYSEPHRAYHTLRHIEHCLDEFEAVRQEARDPVAVEMALWYHDAIYDTRRRDNEELSAVLAEQTAAAAGLSPAFGRRVGDLIRVSTHKKSAADPDGRLFADVDLAILGQEPEAFTEYERQVRQEYAWVPEPEFRAARAKILEVFLDRFSVFATPAFVDKYEKQARLNLTASLLVLKAPSASFSSPSSPESPSSSEPASPS